MRSLVPLLLLCACYRSAGGPTADSLAGLTVPLAPSPALRVVLDGSLNGTPAEIALDPSQPVSFVTSRCARDAPIIARVTVPDAFGPDETFPLARVSGLALGGIHFRDFEAALAGGKTCVVVLGARELSDVAIEVNPAVRTVRFRPTQSREAWVNEVSDSGDDAQVLPVTREPRADWPLLSLRIRQGPTTFDATMLLSLREPRSLLFDDAARAAGLKPGLELLDGLPLPEGVKLPDELSQLRGYAFDTLEFASGFGLTDGSLDFEKGAPPHTAQGLVGADVWGRFVTAYDVGSGLLVLRRPRVLMSGRRAKCEREGATSEEACFELHSQPMLDGLAVTATVWSPLPDGARLSLDVTGGTGACRIGISFPPGDRGRSTHHRFPWKKLGDSVPGCADAFVGASAAAPGLLEESPLPECPGTCAWARDAFSNRLSCECQPGVRTADGEAEKKLLELFRRALEKLEPPREPEPADPD